MTRKDRSTDAVTAPIERPTDILPAASQRRDALDSGYSHRRARLDEIRAALAAAPDESPPPETWHAVQVRLAARRAAAHRGKRRLGAVAAAVTLGAALALLDGARKDRSLEPPIAVADLISESQRLERARRAVALDPREWTVHQRGLALRIIDVDAELAGLHRAGVRGGADEESLWQTRVGLLRALMDEERDARRRQTVY
jgi:hypothetical protein